MTGTLVLIKGRSDHSRSVLMFDCQDVSVLHEADCNTLQQQACVLGVHVPHSHDDAGSVAIWIVFSIVTLDPTLWRNMSCTFVLS